MQIDFKQRRLILQASLSTALAALSGAVESLQVLQNKPARPMPVIFVGHGSPMNAIQANPFTAWLRTWGTLLPRPAAILSISAHWLTRGETLVGIQERPATIHDFGGFPAVLYEVVYSAPGAPALARATASLVRQATVQGSSDWGLDHGTWTVLRHMYPQADIPVFQLSIDYERPAAYHYAVGCELAALRDKGVLIMGSGNIVHNLRMLEPRSAPGAAARPWAQAFDEAVKKSLDARDDKRLIDYARFDGAAQAVPTPDHYYPFLYALGAAGMGEKRKSVYEGFQAGTLSMRCVQFGA